MPSLFTLLIALSGFSFLSAEVIWIREMGLRTGSTPLSASWILMTYFLFAALGSKLGGALASSASASARRYGWVELGVAAALVLLYLPREWVYTTCFLSQPWEHGYALYLFAIPSTLSGMTLPLLAAAFAPPNARERSRSAGFLYAANLTGAALGIPVGGVWLPWKLGYSHSVILLTGLLALVGLAAIIASRWVKPPIIETVSAKDTFIETKRPVAAWASWVMVLSGALTLATEIVVIGYFQVIAEESIYSYSAVLLVFILGLALGAAAAAIFRPSLPFALIVTAILLLLTPVWLQIAFFNRSNIFADDELMLYARLTTVAAIILLPLLAAQGAVFPLAWALLKRHQPPGPAIGHFLLLNKIGSAIGVLLAGYYFVHWLGYTGALALLAAVYAILSLTGLIVLKHRWSTCIAALGAISAAALATTYLAREPIELSNGEKLLGYYYGRSDLISVVEDEVGSRHIRINQAYTLNGTQRAMATQQMEGWMPCVLNPDPKNVLFIGMASGISATAILDFPVTRLSAVELSPEVVKAAHEHFAEWNTPLFEDRRANIIVDDGRHAMEHGPEWAWDLIIGDLFSPIRAGTSQLYSRDYYRRARANLSPQGQCWSWIPAYQFDETMMAATLRAFAESFEYAIVVRANLDPRQPVIGLVGSPQPIAFSADFLEQRLSQIPTAVRKSDPIFFRSTQNLGLAFIGDLHAPATKSYLTSFAANTDDRPLLAFLGPRNFGPGELMRGVKLIEWGSERISQPETPSLLATPASLVDAQRAGNHLYAASMMSILLPDSSPEQNNQRRHRAEYHWRTARELVPEAEIRPSDLRQ